MSEDQAVPELIAASEQGTVLWAKIKAAILGPSPLIGQYTLTCPNCGAKRPYSSYISMEMINRYSPWLVTVYKCTRCSHLFAPVQ